MSKSHFGLIGLGVMGENLVLNAERNGFSSVVYNRTYAKTEDFRSRWLIPDIYWLICGRDQPRSTH